MGDVSTGCEFETLKGDLLDQLNFDFADDLRVASEHIDPV